MDNPYIASARIADAPTAFAGADGDLWPNCWAADGNVYAAYGDGKGFGGGSFSDIGVARISGSPADDGSGLSGTDLAAGDEVGQVWSGGDYTRKPTGMTCVGGTLYLAVQDLAKNFDQAPAATIARSDDGGRTWSWDREKPMFPDSVFTTVMFADFGKDGAWRSDAGVGDYVYAYGLDNNWRDSFTDVVEDPVDLYLARVPRDAVQDRSRWEFFTGASGGRASWSAEIADRKAVLRDTRMVHTAPADQSGAHDLTVISQAGILYDKPLDLYLYTSWTELTFEFYAAESPWGPWKLFASRDFGRYPWTTDAYGGYAATIPSKFLSADGRSGWLQANVCPCAPAGVTQYDFGLRTIEVAPR